MTTRPNKRVSDLDEPPPETPAFGKGSPVADGPEAEPAHRLSLEQEVQLFTERLCCSFETQMKRRPAETKRRVLRLVNRHLPPHPRPTGRRPERRITKATEMYLRQREEIRSRRRRKTNWQEIARQYVPDYTKFRSEYRRRLRAELTKLRNAVYARLGRGQHTNARRVRHT